MNGSAILAPPEAGVATVEKKWAQEYRAFVRLRPTLRRNYCEKYVAIHGGKVVGCGREKIAVALKAYSKFGYVPIYVGLVSAAGTGPTVRIPGPRRIRSRKSR